MSRLKYNIEKYTLRKEQKDVVDFVTTSYNNNKMVKYFLLNLPTGVGKSLISLLLSDFYIDNINPNGKIDIITNNKLLQNQYLEMFSNINDLKGKSNYFCDKYKCTCESGLKLDALNNSKCDKQCPYELARNMYISGEIALTNFYLYLINAIHDTELMKGRKSSMLIVDEAHNFDDVMSDFMSVVVSCNSIKKLKLKCEKSLISKMNGIKDLNDLLDFLSLYKNAIDGDILLLENKLKNNKKKNVQQLQSLTSLQHISERIQLCTDQCKKNPENFLYDIKINSDNGEKDLTISLEPLWASDYLYKYVYSKYDMIVFMSGTILDKDIFCKLNGLNTDDTVYYSIDSPFDVSHRPIHYLPVGKMSYAKKHDTFQLYVPIIEKLLEKYKDKKGIIHTNSFELANWIRDAIHDDRLIYHTSKNKDDMLLYFKESQMPCVMVSPSMDTGVSFDDDLARFQIIAKIPYPSLASKKNKLRMETYREWYSWKTVCGVIQMCGRVVRNEDDSADTIIIDENFTTLYNTSKKYFPEWFINAIHTYRIKNRK